MCSEKICVCVCLPLKTQHFACMTRCLYSLHDDTDDVDAEEWKKEEKGREEIIHSFFTLA